MWRRSFLASKFSITAISSRLGFSIRHLIEATKTEWFVYLHSDVFLPHGWFDAMCARRSEFDWFECNQRITVMADYLLDTTQIARSYSGSQMGRQGGVRPSDAADR